jgi:hypothetical protein
MAERNPPSWLQAGSSSAENDRLSTQGLFAGVPGILVGDTGSSGELAVTAFNGNMTVTVDSGWCVIAGTEVTNQGYYECYNDAGKIVTVPASDPTFGRIDLIVAQVLDAQYSGTQNLFQIIDVPGIPSATPAVPATPKNSIVLAHVAVAALANTLNYSTLTDERVFTSVAGGVRVYNTFNTFTPGITAPIADGTISFDRHARIYYGYSDAAGVSQMLSTVTNAQGAHAVTTAAITNPTGSPRSFVSSGNALGFPLSGVSGLWIVTVHFSCIITSSVTASVTIQTQYQINSGAWVVTRTLTNTCDTTGTTFDTTFDIYHYGSASDSLTLDALITGFSASTFTTTAPNFEYTIRNG